MARISNWRNLRNVKYSIKYKIQYMHTIQDKNTMFHRQIIL